MNTAVYSLASGSREPEAFYFLPPLNAVLAAHYQLTHRNYNTWTYDRSLVTVTIFWQWGVKYTSFVCGDFYILEIVKESWLRRKLSDRQLIQRR